MSVAQRAPVAPRPPVAEQGALLPTLFGEGYGVYRASPAAFVFSYVANILVAVLLIWSGHWAVEHRQQIKQQVVGLVTDVSPYILPLSAKESGGGGGGPT